MLAWARDKRCRTQPIERPGCSACVAVAMTRLQPAYQEPKSSVLAVVAMLAWRSLVAVASLIVSANTSWRGPATSAAERNRWMDWAAQHA